MRVTTAVVPVFAGVAAVVLAASPAAAHVGGPTHGLADGALHPLTGIDHLLAMVAVGGLLAVLVGLVCPCSRLCPSLGMTAGGAGGLAGVVVPGVELAIVVSVVAFGVAVVLGAACRRGRGCSRSLLRPGSRTATRDGAEAPRAANPLLSVLGFVVVTAALVRRRTARRHCRSVVRAPSVGGAGRGCRSRNRHAAPRLTVPGYGRAERGEARPPAGTRSRVPRRRGGRDRCRGCGAGTAPRPERGSLVGDLRGDRRAEGLPAAVRVGGGCRPR